ncbi:WG repeat-containing protein [Candidatus Saccharibacteria bacterium]|nr:WG repeat-containing protein [Candidatus Saccharibacteria bacterium]
MKKFWGKIQRFFRAIPEKLGEFFANKKAFYALIIASAVLVAAVLVFGVIRPFRTMVLGVNVNQRFDQSQLIPFKESGLFGYMDTKGKVVISPRFDKAGAFNGKYALATAGDRDQIINRKGEVQIEALRDAVFYEETTGTWLAGGTLYNKDLKRVSKNKLDVRQGSRGLYPYAEGGENYGIMDARGKEIYDCGGVVCEVEVSVAIRELRDAYALISINNGTRVIINAKNGKVILEYGGMTEVEVKDNNIFAVSSVEDGKQATFYRYIERDRVAVEAEDGVIFSLFDPKNKYFLTDFGETWADRNRSSRYAFYRQKDNSFFSTTARRALTVDELTTGLSLARCGDNRYGINSGDTEILKCEYDDVELLDAALFVFLSKRKGQEIVILKNGSQYTLYDINKGRVLMTTDAPIQTSGGSPFFASYDNRSETVKVYNAITGVTEELPTAGASSWTQGANFFSINSTGRIRYYNNRLEEIRSVSPQ